MSKASQRLERISAEEFKKRVEENPAWAKDLDHPIVVYQYVDMRGSKIEYLSRWLRFSGKDQDGECASFIDCKNLENAEGTYDGSVDFSRSGIKKIGRIKVLGVDRQSWSAYFYKCHNLKRISGQYYGPVAAAESAAKEIKNLRISKQNRDKEKLDLSCTEVSKIDQYSADHLQENQIVWDEHIDDKYIQKIAQAFQIIKEHKNREPNLGDLPKEDASILKRSKTTIVRTIAEAIGADDLLVQQQVPITSPKRRGLLKISTLLTALAALFLYKTTDELTKQVVIDPTVDAIKNTPQLIIDWIDPNTKIKSQTIWPNEFTPALQRYANSSKTEEDKIALARDTILLMGLKPETLLIEPHSQDTKGIPHMGTTTVVNNTTPMLLDTSNYHSIGAYFAKESSKDLQREENINLANSAYHCLSAFEDMSQTLRGLEIETTPIEPTTPDHKTTFSTAKETTEDPKREKATREIKKVRSEKSKSMSLPIAIGID